MGAYTESHMMSYCHVWSCSIMCFIYPQSLFVSILLFREFSEFLPEMIHRFSFMTCQILNLHLHKQLWCGGLSTKWKDNNVQRIDKLYCIMTVTLEIYWSRDSQSRHRLTNGRLCVTWFNLIDKNGLVCYRIRILLLSNGWTNERCCIPTFLIIFSEP